MSFGYINTWNTPEQEDNLIKMKIDSSLFDGINKEPFFHYMPRSCSICGNDAHMSYPGINGITYCNDHLEMKIIGEYFWLCRE